MYKQCNHVHSRVYTSHDLGSHRGRWTLLTAVIILKFVHPSLIIVDEISGVIDSSISSVKDWDGKGDNLACRSNSHTSDCRISSVILDCTVSKRTILPISVQ